MKNLIIFLLTTLSFLTASANKKEISNLQNSAPKVHLSTDVRFGDHIVGGKYQYATEAVSTVENEKSLDELIGVRMNFQDRLKLAKGMR